jgi:DnaJ-class molecular chaperone
MTDLIKAADVLTSLENSQCKQCCGTGKCNDAEVGDMFYRTWTCPSCNGNGWDYEARIKAARED